jgi:hypothetical protein
MKSILILASCCIALGAMITSAPPAEAYGTYSQGKVTNPAGAQEAFGNCKTCHGGFRDTDYSSFTDGKAWSEIYTSLEPGSEPEEENGLHDIHRHIMVDEDNPRGSGGPSSCDVCHLETGRYPVVLSFSASDYLLPPISCMGCHGRAEDAGNDSASEGLGAGLRQHHTNAGVKECMTCHADADPENYAPVGEDVLPPYYSAPDDEFQNKPTDPCNPHGEEDYAAGPKGLDNDGDGRNDKSDPDCRPIGPGNNNGRR